MLERLGGAEVVEGRLELRDAKGVPWLVVGRLDAEMAVDRGRRLVTVRAADTRVGGPDAGLDVTADGTLAIDGGRVVVEQATFTSGASSVVLRGRLDRISPVTATAGPTA